MIALADAGVSVLDCVHATPKDAGEGFPYIAIPNIQDGRVQLEGVRRISLADFEKWTIRTTPQPGDILVTRRGRVGDTAPIPAGLRCAIGQNLVLLRSDGKDVDQAYLKWATRGPLWMAEVDRLRNVGAVFDSLNVRDIARLRIPVPPLAVQRRIADVLGALDDLIDTNNMLMSSLRGLQAGAVLRLSQSATRFVPLGAVAAVRREKATGQDDTPYLGLEHFAEQGRGISSIGRLGDVGNGQQEFRRGDLLYGRLRPYFRKVDRVGFDGACTGEIWVIRPTGEVPLTWLSGIVAAPEFTDFAMAGSEGTKMPRAKWDHVARYQVPLPEEKELTRLDTVLDDFWEQIWALQEENEQLRRTRDELLPLLMSGSVRVKPEGVAA